MGKVRISRNLFIVILGVFVWLMSSMIATAAEIPETETTQQLCTCTCQEIIQDEQGNIEQGEGQSSEDQAIEDIVNDSVPGDLSTQADAFAQDDTNQVDEETEIEDPVSEEISVEEEEVVDENQSNQEDNNQDLNLALINVIMTEIYPAPLSGEIEYITFLNESDITADLTGWYIMDASDKKYIFKETSLIVGESFVLDYSTSKISLNNGGDTIYLYDSVGNLRQSVEYPAVDKGTKLSFDGDNWDFNQDASEETTSNEIVIVENVNDEITDTLDDNQDVESVEVIENVIEASSAEEESQTVQGPEESETSEVEGESILYSPAQISEYQNWLDDSHLTVVGRVISAAGDWVDNRCYLAQENQAIPILCTQLASEFIFNKVQGVQGEVVFKNGGFYRFDPDLLNQSDLEINLSGDPLIENLEAYKIYEYQGLVRDFSEKYRKIEIETEETGTFILRWSKKNVWDFPEEGDVIKGLAMVDSKGQLWLWEVWERLESPDVLDGSEAVEAVESESTEEEPVLPTAYLGLGAAGILGTGKFAWTYKDSLKKFIPKRFRS